MPLTRQNIIIKKTLSPSLSLQELYPIAPNGLSFSIVVPIGGGLAGNGPAATVEVDPMSAPQTVPRRTRCRGQSHGGRGRATSPCASVPPAALDRVARRFEGKPPPAQDVVVDNNEGALRTHSPSRHLELCVCLCATDLSYRRRRPLCCCHGCTSHEVLADICFGLRLLCETARLHCRAADVALHPSDASDDHPALAGWPRIGPALG